jgi:cytochrome c oxidase subunit 4
MGNHNQSSTHTEHHIMPFATYMKVAGALFILTFLTVGFHSLREYLGAVAPLIAFAIAAVKAFLVMAWFMHLKYENIMNRVIFATGFIFLALLFLISIIDIYSRVTVNSVL